MKLSVFFFGLSLIFLLGILFYFNLDFRNEENDFEITGRVIYTDYIGDIIFVPVKVHLVKVEDDSLSTVRDEENIIQLFGEVNRIWEDSNIYFSVEEVVHEEISKDVYLNSQRNLQFISEYTKTDEKYIDAYFMRSIGGPNGVAFPELNYIFVSDITTVNDFRATSHEFGHILDLVHVPNSNFLMARGRNGEFISDFEIGKARNAAFDLFV